MPAIKEIFAPKDTLRAQNASVIKIAVSKNSETKLLTFVLSQRFFLPNFCLIFAKINTSENSEIANAIRDAAEKRMDIPKIVLYALFVERNLVLGGREVANIEKRSKKKIIKRLLLTMLCARALP